MIEKAVHDPTEEVQILLRFLSAENIVTLRDVSAYLLTFSGNWEKAAFNWRNIALYIRFNDFLETLSEKKGYNDLFWTS